MTNSVQFLLATDQIKKLRTQPDNSELSILYGWYKQATVGDINVSKPGFFDLKGQAKWDAWNKVKGATLYDAEINYIMIVNSLIKKYGVN